jgi:hypothetical protein
MDGTLLGRLELPLAGVDPNRVARDQVVLDGDLEDLPEGVMVLLIGWRAALGPG